MKIKVYGKNSNKTEMTISPAVFGIKTNPRLISQAVQAMLANRRQPIAHSKTRGEVRGGGRKPWRQKGTGNARAGSIRSPLWRGGGVTFGPRNNRNFSKSLNQKMATGAVKMVLSDKNKSSKLFVVADFSFPKASTAAIQDFLEKLPIKEGRILIVLAKTNINLELSSANLKYLKTVLVDGINLIDLVNFDYLVIDKEGLKMIEERLGKK